MTEEEKAEFEAAKAAALAAKEEAEAIKADLATKEAELLKLQQKEMNFGKVRKSEEEKEAEIDSLKKSLAEFETRTIVEKKDKYLNILAGSDAELKKVIDVHFNRLGKDAKTEAEVEVAMKEAYLLATKTTVDKGILNQINNVNGNSNIIAKNHGNANNQVDPKLADWASEFNKHGANIETDDLKNDKYKVKRNQSAESNYQL